MTKKSICCFIVLILALLATTCAFAAGAAVSDPSKAQVGGYLRFGKYEQDNNSSNGAETILWRVVDRQGSFLLLISEYGLDTMVYNDGYSASNWEKSSVRRWLNGTFYNKAFSKKEQSIIATYEVIAEIDTQEPRFAADNGNTTEDRIFLLSTSEARYIFPTDSSRRCSPTAYARERGAFTDVNGYGEWWLRTVVGDGTMNRSIYAGGELCGNGCASISMPGILVRPALWVLAE